MTFKPGFSTVFITISLSFPCTLSGQSKEVQRIDSLLKILPAMPDDTGKVKLLNDLSFTCFTIDPDKGVSYGEQAKTLAQKLNWQKGIADACHSLGANYWAKHNLAKAQEYYWNCLKINEILGDKQGTAKGFHNLAVVYETEYNYAKALEYYRKAFDLYVVMNDRFSKLGCLANIANIYEVQQKFPEALAYFKQSLKLCKEMGNERHVAYMSGRIGEIYNYQGEYSRALEYEMASLETMKRYSNNADIAAVLANIGSIYRNQHDYKTALEYFRKALHTAETGKGNWSRGFVGEYAGYIGRVYISMASDKKWRLHNKQADARKLIENAKMYLKRSIDMAQLSGDEKVLRDSYQALSEAEALNGNFAASLRYFKKYSDYKDSLNSLKKDREMTRHELEYSYGKQKDSLDYRNKLQQSELQSAVKEKELTKLTLRQQWLYSIIAISALILTGSFFIFRHRINQLRLKNELTKEKAEKKLKETEYQKRINDITFAAIRSQMNPHFIFNVLNTIQSYVYMNDKKNAITYLGKFSELIRKILDNSHMQEISLSEEITLLQLYIDIEKARFGDKLRASIETDTNLDVEDIVIPPMLIQPFVENAIKHGLLHLSGDKWLLIHIGKSENNQYVEITIDDNGIGREKSTEINSRRLNHRSFANAANEKRIDLINFSDDRKAKLEIIDKKNADGSAAGTTVVIQIPLQMAAI